MNINKKQKRIPTWLPTTVALLAIIATILFIYILVTFIGQKTEGPATTPTPAATETPEPTKDPDLVYSSLPLSTEDRQSTFHDRIKDYLTENIGSSFSADSLMVSKKQTPKENTTLVYARYLKDGVFQVSELITTADSIQEASSDETLTTFLKLSRNNTDVAAIYIQSLISNFYSYRNSEDKAVLASILSTKSEDDAQNILSRMEYLESITLLSLSINRITSATVDYVIFASEETKLIGIDTAAPGLSELLVTLDADNYPMIFLGETDAEADQYRNSLKSSSTFKALSDNIKEALNAALESDADLKQAYENMTKK